MNGGTRCPLINTTDCWYQNCNSHYIQEFGQLRICLIKGPYETNRSTSFFFSTDRYEDLFQVAERPNKIGVFLHHYKTHLKDHLQCSSVSQVSCAGVGVRLRTVVGVFACPVSCPPNRSLTASHSSPLLNPMDIVTDCNITLHPVSGGCVHVLVCISSKEG